ncbi:MAG: YncE family protein [Sphingobacteriales bacterium]|nr:YncE family protein [Sphingobacteriales bacterium]
MTTVACAQSVPKKTLLALSKTDHMLSVIDPSDFKILARIPVGQDPHEVIASADGLTAFVTIYGGGSLHELDVIDLAAQKPLRVVDTKPLFGPHGISFANGKVWFSAEGSKAVGSYNPATNQLDWSMGTGQDRTHMIYVTDDAKRIYTTNVSSGTVSILVDTLIQPDRMPPPPAGNTQQQPPAGPPPNFGPRTQWIHTVLPTAKGSEGFDVTPDAKELWTASSEDGSITVIDVMAKKVITKMDAKTFGANRLKITPDGKMAFISSLRDGQLYIYDVASRKELKRISVGHGAAGILMDPDGTRALVACSADNYVAVVDLKTLTVITHFDVGPVPDGLAWAIHK